MFRRPGKPPRSIYMEEVDRIDDYDRRSYFTHRSIRYDDAATRSQSLTTKSSRSQRPTWKPRIQKDTKRDEPPTDDQHDDIQEI